MKVRDPRGGSGGSEGRRLDEGELRGLQRWQRRMVAIFAATWIYLPLVFGVHLLIGLSDGLLRLALVPALLLVAAGAVVQFSRRCPSCGYRLGFQSRLLVPDHCRSCGVALRRLEE